MISLKKTIRMCKIVIKLQPFFLFYALIQAGLGVIGILMPIGIVRLIVGYYENGKEFFWVVIACSAFAVGYYLINVIYFYLSKLYNINNRNFNAQFEVVIFNKLKEIDYEVYQSSKFLNDYTRAIDEGPGACMRCFWSVSNLFSEILGVITVFTIFATLNPIIIVYAVVIGVIFFFLGKYNAKIYWNLSEIQKQKYRERAYIKRQFYLKDSSQDIRTSNVKDLFLDINDDVGDKVIKNTDKYLSKRAYIRIIANFLVKSIYPVALGFICYMTLQSLNFVDFVALTIAASTLGNYVYYLSDSFASLESNATQSEAVIRILDYPGGIEISGNREVSELNSIRLENVEFGYGENLVLKDLNLLIKKGAKVAVVGENGAGKTTFVKLLLRLYDVKGGSVYYNDVNYKEIYPYSIRKRIGAVFQDFEVYAFSVAENVLLRKPMNEDDRTLVINALKFSGLYEKISKLEQGIDTIVTKEFDKDGIELSGGEKQKLAIARAYAGEFDLIILDEPSSALDPIAEAEIYEKMMKLGHNRTLIFISHRLSSTIQADQIYLFEEGRIVESGSHQELMKIDNGKYKYMFNIQASKYVEGSM